VNFYYLLMALSAGLGLCSCAPHNQGYYKTQETIAPKRATSKHYKIKGVWYHPQQHYEYVGVGIASYYGDGEGFHGKKTSTGEIFDRNQITAAHKTLPLPCVVCVTNLKNGRSMKFKVNDRGPFIKGRIIDLSRKGAQILGFYKRGTVGVRVETLVDESILLPENCNSNVRNWTVYKRGIKEDRQDLLVGKTAPKHPTLHLRRKIFMGRLRTPPVPSLKPIFDRITPIPKTLPHSSAQSSHG
jgi:rare lipoprotein A (peptidoglycan hydrolase)